MTGMQLPWIRTKKWALLSHKSGEQTVKGKATRNFALETESQTQFHPDTLFTHFSSLFLSAQIHPFQQHVGKMAIYLQTQI